MKAWPEKKINKLHVPALDCIEVAFLHLPLGTSELYDECNFLEIFILKINLGTFVKIVKCLID